MATHKRTMVKPRRLVVLVIAIFAGSLLYLLHLNNVQGAADRGFKPLRGELKAIGFDLSEADQGECSLDKDAGILLRTHCSAAKIKSTIDFDDNAQAVYETNIKNLEAALTSHGWRPSSSQSLEEILNHVGPGASLNLGYFKKIGRTRCNLVIYTSDYSPTLTLEYDCAQNRMLLIF